MKIEEKFCNDCAIILTDGNWYQNYQKSYKHICKKCENARTAKWHQEN